MKYTVAYTGKMMKNQEKRRRRQYTDTPNKHYSGAKGKMSMKALRARSIERASALE